MMERLGTVVVGLGSIGYWYDHGVDKKDYKDQLIARTHARAIHLSERFYLVGGIDLSLKARTAFTAAYSRSTWSNLDELMADDKSQSVKCIVFAVGAKAQVEMLESYIRELKPKLVLLEKPIADTISDLERVRRIEKSYPETMIAVNYPRVYLDALRRVKGIIGSGQLGFCIHGSVFYGKGLVRNGTHFINLLEYLLGELVMVGLPSGLREKECWDAEADFRVAAIEHKKASINFTSLGKSGFHVGEVDLWFENGRITWRNQSSYIELWKTSLKDDGWNYLSDKVEKFDVEQDCYQYRVWEVLGDALETYGVDNRHCSIEAACRAALLAMKVRDTLK